MKPIPSMVVKDGQIVPASSTPSLNKGLYLGALGAVALFAVGLGGYWLGLSGRSTSTATADPGAALQAAVSDAQTAARPTSEDEKRFLQAQQAYLQQTPETPEQVKARLDRLASDPKALQAYNANVLNRVTAAAPTQGTAAELAKAVDAAQQTATDSKSTAALQAEAAQREAAGRTYVVKPGDTLWAIAAQVYGDPHQFQRLFAANPRVLASPDHIFPGQVLRVPG